MRVAAAGTEAVLIPYKNTTSVTSLGGHASGIAFASRRAEDFDLRRVLGGGMSDVSAIGRAMGDENVADPHTGLVLRLRITEEHYQYRAALSCLWGTGVPDSSLLVRIQGQAT